MRLLLFGLWTRGVSLQRDSSTIFFLQKPHLDISKASTLNTIVYTIKPAAIHTCAAIAAQLAVARSPSSPPCSASWVYSSLPRLTGSLLARHFPPSYVRCVGEPRWLRAFRLRRDSVMHGGSAPPSWCMHCSLPELAGVPSAHARSVLLPLPISNLVGVPLTSLFCAAFRVPPAPCLPRHVPRRREPLSEAPCVMVLYIVVLIYYTLRRQHTCGNKFWHIYFMQSDKIPRQLRMILGIM